jgi:hypothetical protein
MFLPSPAPNEGLEPTPRSVRSCLAPASRRGSGPAFGIERRHLPTRGTGKTSEIQWAFGLFDGDALHRMGRDHRRSDIAVSESLLNRPDIIMGLEHVARKAVAKHMG